MRWGWAALIGLSIGAGCGNTCHFEERCDGNIREVCGEPGQLAGREVVRSPCDTLNSACVEIDEAHAVCVASPITVCDPDFVGTCNGDLLTVCTEVGTVEDTPVHYVLRQDCAAWDEVCVESGLGGACE